MVRGSRLDGMFRLLFGAGECIMYIKDRKVEIQGCVHACGHVYWCVFVRVCVCLCSRHPVQLIFVEPFLSTGDRISLECHPDV